MFRGPRNAVEKYTYDHSVRLHTAQKKLIERTNALPNGFMMTPADEIQLLQNMCRAINAKRTIDVGVFTGYSSLAIALALPSNGNVYALDITDQYLQMTNSFELWREAEVDKKIELRLGNAVKTMEDLLRLDGPNSFDYCYIDADKLQYMNYYELALKLVRSGGIIAIDNTLWMGQVLNPNANDPDTEAIKILNDHIAKDQRVYVSFLNMGDGVTICFKK